MKRWYKTTGHQEGGVITKPDNDEKSRKSSFDTLHPPSTQQISKCVHCGFCLPACPTYQLWGEEMDSPRGRIDLMRQAAEGKVKLDRAFGLHIDTCLGCMACMTACPSGVQYDQLIEATRAQVERAIPRSFGDKAFRSFIFWLFPYPERLRVAAFLGLAYKGLGLSKIARSPKLAAVIPRRIATLEELLPDIGVKELLKGRTITTQAVSKTKGTKTRVGLQTGCVASIFFNEVHRATVRVLEAEGIEVVAPRKQGCCGALSQHAGRDEAVEFAKSTIALWESVDVDFIVTNAAGCGSAQKEYASLLAHEQDWSERAQAFSAKMKDIMELLDEIEPVATRHPIKRRIAYHDACHHAHAQGIKAQPRRVLSNIPELEILEVPDGGTCCGSAGIYNLLFSEPAVELGTKKAQNIESVRPQIVAAANPGCLMQIERFLKSETVLIHPIMLIDASIRNDPSSLLVKNHLGSKNEDLTEIRT